jgi:hypothetical protein
MRDGITAEHAESAERFLYENNELGFGKKRDRITAERAERTIFVQSSGWVINGR